ncbi:MAG: hypothetical protein IJ562_04735 [Prevotella sp.]|nr:hypothetical protein [Prevotella sp.]
MILHKSRLRVSFTKESDGRWFVDFPNWPLSHDNLEMVAGADDLLDILNDKTPNHVSLEVTTYESPHDVKLKKVHSALTKGAFYIVETPLVGWETNPNAIRKKQLWLCPVTLTVLGYYPESIYFKVLP